ncbi:hypothetical protein HJC23_011663 [Cyclotella cryptica]|uniref:Uncharacterized protein n=1 Tax=Cyclotella cryptica TaxID=29204 RepID=A0ABD3NTG8_9STRA
MGGCLSKSTSDVDPLNDSRRAPVLSDGSRKNDNGDAAAPSTGGAEEKTGD